jgi:predicted enzyme related to lactoylglutathione lyase
MPQGELASLRFVVVDVSDPEAEASFWSRVLGVDVAERVDDRYVILRPAADGAPSLTFQRVPEPKSGKNRLHFDLIVPDIDASTAELETVGASRAPEGDFEEEGYRWRVMRDPEGNEFCIAIMPD